MLEAGELGLGDAALAATGITFGDLGPEQLGEEGAVREVVTDGRLGELLVLGPDRGQAQRPAGLVDRQTRRALGLWERATDPGEQHDLLAPGQAPPEELAAALAAAGARLAELAARHASDGEAPVLPEELEKHLRDLGYVGD